MQLHVAQSRHSLRHRDPPHRARRFNFYLRLPSRPHRCCQRGRCHANAFLAPMRPSSSCPPIYLLLAIRQQAASCSAIAAFFASSRSFASCPPIYLLRGAAGSPAPLLSARLMSRKPTGATMRWPLWSSTCSPMTAPGPAVVLRTPIAIARSLARAVESAQFRCSCHRWAGGRIVDVHSFKHALDAMWHSVHAGLSLHASISDRSSGGGARCHPSL